MNPLHMPYTKTNLLTKLLRSSKNTISSNHSARCDNSQSSASIFVAFYLNIQSWNALGLHDSVLISWQTALSIKVYTN